MKYTLLLSCLIILIQCNNEKKSDIEYNFTVKDKILKITFHNNSSKSYILLKPIFVVSDADNKLQLLENCTLISGKNEADFFQDLRNFTNYYEKPVKDSVLFIEINSDNKSTCKNITDNKFLSCINKLDFNNYHSVYQDILRKFYCVKAHEKITFEYKISTRITNKIYKIFIANHTKQELDKFQTFFNCLGITDSHKLYLDDFNEQQFFYINNID